MTALSVHGPAARAHRAPVRPARPWDRAGWFARARIALPLLAAAGLALAGLGVSLVLTARAGASSRARTRLDQAQTSLSDVRTLPYSVSAPVNAPPALIARQLSSAEVAVNRRLRALEAAASGPERTTLTAIRPLVSAYFGALRSEVPLIERSDLGDADVLNSGAASLQAQMEARFNIASSIYDAQGAGALAQARVGGIAIVLALFLGFVFFYRSALRARRAAETLARELCTSEAHLERAQQLAGVGSWELDLATRSLACTREFSSLHGWVADAPSHDADGFLAAVAADDRDRVRGVLRTAIENGTAAQVDYGLRPEAGGRLVHLEVTPLRGDGGAVTALMGTCQDVTDRFMRAEAERANRMKDEFISRMSHELRTPLNAILGFGQLLSMAELGDREHGQVERILSAGRHLLDLINEILDISRIESGDLRLSLEPVLLDAAISEAIDLVAPLASARRIEVTVEKGPAVHWVRADVQRLKQVLLNLLSNAIKYNRDGGRVMIAVSAVGDRVRLRVCDTGPGITPEWTARLFHPFERLGQEKGTVEGTGLGLALSKGMVESMGGLISAESELGIGSTFTVELEAAQPDTAGRQTPRLAQAILESTAATRTVLCIEDNLANLAVIEETVKQCTPAELLTAVQGTIGTMLAVEHRPDVILLDLDLPDIPGWEVLARLKAHPRTSAIPVIVITANATRGDLERLMTAGAAAYLTKPVDLERLLSAIDGELKRTQEEA